MQVCVARDRALREGTPKPRRGLWLALHRETQRHWRERQHALHLHLSLHLSLHLHLHRSLNQTWTACGGRHSGVRRRAWVTKNRGGAIDEKGTGPPWRCQTRRTGTSGPLHSTEWGGRGH